MNSQSNQKFRWRDDAESIQIRLRIIVATTMIGWFLVAQNLPALNLEKQIFLWTFFVSCVYLVVSIGAYIGKALRSEKKNKKQGIWLLLDPIAFGAIFFLAGKSAIPFLFLFLWIPLDNGFRYGEKYLYASLVCFIPLLCAVIGVEPYWQGREWLGIGIIVNVVMLSVYAIKLLGRLHAANTKLSSMATRDALTKLPNRHLFIEHLRHSMALTNRNKKYCACIFIDLDGFKFVNDAYGHAVGDALLINVSEKITACLRDTDMVARLGGDEFAIAAECVSVPVDAVLVAERVRDALSGITAVNGSAITIAGSIGVAWYQADTQPMTVDTLINNADHAMYAAKKAGRCCIRAVDQQGQIVDVINKNEEQKCGTNC